MITIAGNNQILPDTVRVLGIGLSRLTRSELTGRFESFLKTGEKGWIGSVNAYVVNLAAENFNFHRFFSNSLLNYCDGFGVRIGAWILGCSLPETIPTADWIIDVFRVAADTKKKLYFLGAKQKTIVKAVAAVSKRFPEVTLVGFHHGYFSSQENQDILDDIVRKSPDVLVVGMGAPQQEQWILDNFERTGATIALNVGAVFDYLSGDVMRAPQSLRKLGLEWLFRLFLEPRRMWRRYLVGNAVFLWRVLLARIRRLDLFSDRSMISF